MIRYTKDTDHIATLTLDMQGRPFNVLNHEIVDAFLPVIDLLKQEKSKGKLRGVILTSAKKNFLSSGDIEYLSKEESAEKIFNFSEKLKRFFRDIEKPGVPFATVINGAAIGTGFELALACHRRFMFDRPDVRIGMPEVTFGLMPGNGGVIRLMWLLGIEKTFAILTGGRSWSAAGALAAGLVDETGGDEAALFQKAKKWLLDNKNASRPWDLQGASIPGGTARTPATARLLSALAAGVSARWRNNFPAPQSILNTLSEGSVVDFETACRIESRYFTGLLRGRESKNMIQVLWFDQNDIARGISRPKGYGRFRPRRVGIVGAGAMGSGIAGACLSEGMEVILKDVSRMIAQQGKDRVGQILDVYIQKGKLDETGKVACLNRIKTTESSADFKDCDLVIESVFENLSVKKKVITTTEEYLDEHAFLASNTVSIPITRLAENSIRPGQFIGLHFFKPVEEVSLVEIVRGNNTSDETIAKAYDFVQAIGKTPIVVKDTWGFYVARVQNTYILEGITLLQEGYSPTLIENMGKQAGMAAGALELADDLSLDLVLRYEQQAAEHYGAKYIRHPAVDVLKKMLEELNRPGLAKKAGFYSYVEMDRQLWSGLNQHFPTTQMEFNANEIMERLLFAQVLEAVWCLQEGIVTTMQEANLGSMFGWGFPSFKGGVIQYIRDYGKEQFIARCGELATAHGQRFSVPKWLKSNF